MAYVILFRRKFAIRAVLAVMAIFVVTYSNIISAIVRSDSTSRIMETNQPCRVPRLELWPENYAKFDQAPVCQVKKNNGDENAVWMERGVLRISPNVAASQNCYASRIVRNDDFHSTYEELVHDVSDGWQAKWNNFRVACLPNRVRDVEDIKQMFGTTEGHFICGSFPPQTIPYRVDQGANNFNVLLLGLDSTSRMAALRYLPKTMAYVKDLTNAYQMKMYHIVGDGTTASLMALLTGYFEDELPESRRSHVQPTGNTTVLDSFPWLWNAFSQIGGYATQYNEDMPRFGTFHYRLVGFGSEPTHSYGRPCFLASSLSEPRQQAGCIGVRFTHDVLLESLREFFYAYADRPRFSLTFISELVHENPAYAALFDDDLKAMLEQIQQDDEQTGLSQRPGPFANTIVVLFADHGSRIGSARQSLQGKLEERLPLLSVMLPKRFRIEWPEAEEKLRINTERLLTMFDMHATLEHLLSWQYGARASGHIGKTRGQSLFTEIPLNRTCTQAAIAAHWCTCLQWYNFTNSGRGKLFGWPQEVNVAATAVVNVVNEKIQQMNSRKSEQFQRCSTMVLSEITSAERAQLPDEMVRFVHSKDSDGRVPEFAPTRGSGASSMHLVRLAMVMRPLNAKIEANVRMSDPFTVDRVVQLQRVDRYEPNAWCQPVTEWPELRPYCVCPNSPD